MTKAKDREKALYFHWLEKAPPEEFDGAQGVIEVEGERAIYDGWLKSAGMDEGWPVTDHEPKNKKEFAEKYGLKVRTLFNWDREYRAPVPEKKKGQSEKERLIEHLERKIYGIADKEGKYSAKDLETYVKVMGWITEKEEITHKFELSADDHARIREGAARKVRELVMGTNRVGGLLTEPTVLPDAVRENNGRGQPEDN